MKIHYFAWMREHTKCAHEEINLPDGVNNVEQLIAHLKTTSAGHETALRNIRTVRVAVNKQYAQLEDAVSNDDEVAFFPPVTGG